MSEARELNSICRNQPSYGISLRIYIKSTEALVSGSLGWCPSGMMLICCVFCAVLPRCDGDWFVVRHCHDMQGWLIKCVRFVSVVIQQASHEAGR